MSRIKTSQEKLENFIHSHAIKRGCSHVGILKYDEAISGEMMEEIQVKDQKLHSIVIIAMQLDDPAKDAWTESQDWTRGGKNFIDQILANIAYSACLELDQRGFPSKPLSYNGSFLKHLAVRAGLGIIGMNNLLITPDLGPNIRLRGYATSAMLEPSKPLLDSFHPCDSCPEPPPCILACPAKAFLHELPSELNNIYEHLPKSDYNKDICLKYCLDNLESLGPTTKLWCRKCEEACVLYPKKVEY